MTTPTIEILRPLSGEPFGVGFSTIFRWTGVGPVLDPIWHVDISDPDNIQPLAVMQVPVTDPHVFTHVTMSNNGQIPELIGQVTDGGNARLNVQLYSGTTPVDGIAIPVLFRMHDGGTVVLQQEGVTGGFSPSDRDLLQAVFDAVHRTFETDA